MYLSKNSKIVYQGVEGSFSYIVGKKYFGENNTFAGTKEFKDIFNFISRKSMDYGVIPIENSLAGSVYENYDLLNKHKKIKIIGEAYLKIEHHLMIPGICGKSLKPVKKVLSHAKALEQCTGFFNNYPSIEKVVHFDTAAAAKYISSHGDCSMAAIASKEASQIYNLKIISKNIEDNPLNFTRFLLIDSKQKTISSDKEPDKSSLIFRLPHFPGSLYHALEVFFRHELNLSKIESRPIHGKPFEYLFYIDLDFEGRKISEIKEIIEEFKARTAYLRILGFYNSQKNISFLTK